MKTMISILKRTLGVLLAAMFAVGATAQTLSVYTQGGNVVEVYGATADDMVYTAGVTAAPSVSIQGKNYVLSEVEKIVVKGSETAALDSTVSVVYDGSTASVTVSGDIAPYVTVTVDGARVSCMADTTFKRVITYNLSGSSSNGAFIMDGKAATRLNLNNLTLTASDTAAINILNGKLCNVTINGENTLVDGASGGQKACFFINGHAVFHGSGTLNLTGNARHAYRSDEYTQFVAGDNGFAGTVNVRGAAVDGLNVQQYLRIESGTFNISGNQGDGIDVGVTNDATDEFNGQLFLMGGTVNAGCPSVDTKAIVADSLITIGGATLRLTAQSDGSKGIKAKTDLQMNSGYVDLTVSGASYKTIENGVVDNKRCHGMKVDGDLYLRGGTINGTRTSTDAKSMVVKIDGTFYYSRGSYTLTGDAVQSKGYFSFTTVKAL